MRNWYLTPDGWERCTHEQIIDARAEDARIARAIGKNRFSAAVQAARMVRSRGKGFQTIYSMLVREYGLSPKTAVRAISRAISGMEAQYAF